MWIYMNELGRESTRLYTVKECKPAECPDPKNRNLLQQRRSALSQQENIDKCQKKGLGKRIFAKLQSKSARESRMTSRHVQIDRRDMRTRVEQAHKKQNCALQRKLSVIESY